MSKRRPAAVAPPHQPAAAPAAEAPPVSRALLLVNLVVCGMSSIAAEVAAFRLLAPYFGSTQFITTNVLGVVLASLALGYWIGGRVADRRPSASVLFGLTLASGLALAALPLAATPVLHAAKPAIGNQNAALFLGTLASMVLLFAIPVGLLGMISPFTIRLLAAGRETAGSRSGVVFALSTCGSIAGAYLPTLLTIPLLGTRGTIYAFAAVLLALAAVGLLTIRRAGRAAAALAGAALASAAIASPVPLKGGAGVLAEVETPYHLARVLRDDVAKRNLLELNEGLSYHSVEFDDGRLSPAVWGFFHLLPWITGSPPPAGAPARGAPKPELRVCIVGLAAGTIATQLQRGYADAYDLRIDGVEIDPVIVDLGRRFFRLEERALRVFVEDGRTFLARTAERYDLILGDAYRQPYIPAHLVTTEFFRLASSRLKPGGVCALNVGSIDPSSVALRGIANAMLESFPSVERFAVANDDVPFTNFVLLGASSPVRAAWANVSAPNLRWFRDVALKSWRAVGRDPDAPTFTDDRAPVEWYTDLSLFDYLAR